VPFDHGRFELVLEKTNGEPVDSLAMRNNLVQIRSHSRKQVRQAAAAEFEELILCRGCDRHVLPDTRVCPFCQGDIKALQKQHDKNLREARKAYQRLLKLLPPMNHE
jgi:hypothetical protein